VSEAGCATGQSRSVAVRKLPLVGDVRWEPTAGVLMPSSTQSPLTWLAIGVRVLDTGSGRIGVVQLLRDDVGSLRTGVIERPTHVLLRPVGGREPLWWAPVSSLEELLRRPR
jgi:hypothetical protein